MTHISDRHRDESQCDCSQRASQCPASVWNPSGRPRRKISRLRYRSWRLYMTRHVRVPWKLKFVESMTVERVNFYYAIGHVFDKLFGFYRKCHICHKERDPSQYEDSQCVCQCPASSPSLDGHRHHNSRTCLHIGHTFHWCRRLSPCVQQTLKKKNVDICKSKSLLLPQLHILMLGANMGLITPTAF